MATSLLENIDPEGGRLLTEALGSWQRRRARQYCFLAAAFFLLAAMQLGYDLWMQGFVTWSNWIDVCFTLGLFILFLVAARLFGRMAPRPRQVARLFGWMMVIAGATGIVASLVILYHDAQFWDQGPGDAAATATGPLQRSAVAASTALFIVFCVHFVGSLFVALSPWGALWPLLPLWTLYAGGVLMLEGPLSYRLLLAALFPVAGGPGLVWSVWRHERWVDRVTISMLGGRYGEIRRDLSDARRVHEAIFPPPIETGPLRLHYAYEPMREVGGDFLFARRIDPSGSGEEGLLVVLVDVTGHGVASALAVTRIHAMVSLAAGEQRTQEPGALMARLNAFVAEELAPQGIYATAIAVAFHPRAGRLRWASAGHPPAMLRHGGAPRGGASVEETVVELPSTCPMLGALPSELFEPAPEELPFGVGDAVVLCTDGLIEAEASERRAFGVEGLREVVRSRTAGFAEAAMLAVRAHRAGPAADDTLVVEVVGAA